MDSWGIRLSARDLGIRLSVTKDDELRCKPADRLTPELREEIRANREDLLYDVLLADALRYVAVERHVEDGPRVRPRRPPGSDRRGVPRKGLAVGGGDPGGRRGGGGRGLGLSYATRYGPPVAHGRRREKPRICR
ncbi:MAG: hypothetical protein M3P49_08000 [Actinomycetota bacterium]|nr:hypothetical protein [Actinomycetota bacterium]